VPRWRLLLEYAGDDFCGWQLQARGRTVQGVLEEALARILGAPARPLAASRTDAGVHAAGQVAHVDASAGLGPDALRRALNAVLPRDLAVLELERVADGFDARRDARGKRYVYRLLNRSAPSPLRRSRTWHLRDPLDLAAMGRAAQLALGTHDFAAFRGSVAGLAAGQGSVRTLWRLEPGVQGDEVVVIVEGRSFLRHMVRNLVGTLVQVGRGRLPPEAMREILESRDRSRAGPTAPAHGLCLERVDY
jgi:tRNA pseudouridine38-40 synthase